MKIFFCLTLIFLEVTFYYRECKKGGLKPAKIQVPFVS